MGNAHLPPSGRPSPQAKLLLLIQAQLPPRRHLAPQAKVPAYFQAHICPINRRTSCLSCHQVFHPSPPALLPVIRHQVLPIVLPKGDLSSPATRKRRGVAAGSCSANGTTKAVFTSATPRAGERTVTSNGLRRAGSASLNETQGPCKMYEFPPVVRSK